MNPCVSPPAPLTQYFLDFNPKTPTEFLVFRYQTRVLTVVREAWQMVLRPSTLKALMSQNVPDAWDAEWSADVCRPLPKAKVLLTLPSRQQKFPSSL